MKFKRASIFFFSNTKNQEYVYFKMKYFRFHTFFFLYHFIIFLLVVPSSSSFFFPLATSLSSPYALTSSDGKPQRLASASKDGTVKVWDTYMGKMLYSLSGNLKLPKLKT